MHVAMMCQCRRVHLEIALSRKKLRKISRRCLRMQQHYQKPRRHLLQGITQQKYINSRYTLEGSRSSAASADFEYSLCQDTAARSYGQAAGSRERSNQIDSNTMSRLKLNMWICPSRFSAVIYALKVSGTDGMIYTFSTNATIQGLTADHPSLTTFFEGEIIGPKYTFQTKEPTWGASEKIDEDHWQLFPAYRSLKREMRYKSFTSKDWTDREHLFMRWKEYFLVPDHRVRAISGASFEGFYYICFNQISGSVSGIYFHQKSEKYVAS
jgi:hypothetical protein